MWGHYLLTLYRSLTRHRLYAALNLLGLAVGIAVFLVLGLLVRFETSFDRWIPNADNVYRINATYTFPGRPTQPMAMTSAGVLPALLADYPQVLAGTRVLANREPVSNGPLINNETVSFVDPAFLKVLDLTLAAGDARTALSNPNNLIISQTVATKYFGGGPALGGTLTLSYRGAPQLYRVSGVLQDLPANTHLKLDMIAPFSGFVLNDPFVGVSQWGAPSCWTYVRFRNSAEARSVGADLARFVGRRGHDDYLGAELPHVLHLSFAPLPSLHFTDVTIGSAATPGADARLVYSLGAVAALTLLIAMFNYVNLATARSALRAKEIAVRKVMGATRRTLIAQLLAEAVAFAALASLLGLALAELALPMVNTLGGASLTLAYRGSESVLPWLAALTLIIGLGAGLYPALLMSGLDPALVLASARTPGGGRLETRVRTALTCAQFAVAIGFTVAALVIASQAQFLRTAERGFRREGLILVDSFRSQDLGPRLPGILVALRQTPGVVAVTTADEEPGLMERGLIHVRRPGQKSAAMVADVDVVGDDYLQAFDAGLSAGRMLGRGHGLDDIGESGREAGAARGVNLMLNEQAAHLLDFTSPTQAIGQRVETDGGSGAVVGVLRDLRFDAPQRPVAATVYFYSSRQLTNTAAAVRYAGVTEAEIKRRLGVAWRRQAPMIPFEAKTADERMSDYYVPDQQRARLFTLGSVLAVAIGCFGLYGLAAFNTARRFKEIGIRKTLGASSFDILRLLLAQILRPVLVANLAAWPLAWFAMRGWLDSFDQRISLSPMYFIAASLLALAVACLTVLAQSWQLARSEPAKALRHE